MNSTMELKILQINIRSLVQNKNILEIYLERENIDVAILCEICIPDEHTIPLTFSKYNFYANIRENALRASGGVGFLIKKHFVVKFKKFNLSNVIEAAEIEVVNSIRKVKIVSFYVSDRNGSVSEIKANFELLINKYNGLNNVLMAGDANGWHPLWNKNGDINGKGREIANCICNSEFIVLNTGEHTYQINRDGQHIETAIDITLVSPNLSGISDWVRRMDDLGSDHLPIVVTMFDHDLTVKRPGIIKINRKKLEENISNINPTETTDMDDFEQKLSEAIKKATYCTTPLQGTTKYWWNNDIEILWKLKKCKEKAYNKFKNLYAATELKQATANLRNAIRNAKREKWKEFMLEITPGMKSKDLWHRINLLNNKRKRPSGTVINNAEKMQQFLNYNYREDTNIENNTAATNRTRQTIRVDDEPTDFTNVQQVSSIIQKSKLSAPGINGISNAILKQLGPDYIAAITRHFNEIWKTLQTPNEWKRLKIIAVPKPGKDAAEIQNYRPITLISTLAKIFNKILLGGTTNGAARKKRPAE